MTGKGELPPQWLITGDDPSAPLLILAHGAGAGFDTPFMTMISEAMSARGVMVARFEFAYMRRRRETGKRGGPGRAERLLGEYEARVREWAARAPVFIGGKSMGGRIASMLADDLHGQGLVSGLVCLGYPFHPPGKPRNTRTAHLETLETPALICQGERDPFGNRQDVASYALSGAIAIHWAPDGDHDLKPRVKSGHTWEGNIQAAARAATVFIRDHA